MATRTVRPDEQAEQALEEVTEATGMNVGQALRTGLLLLRQEISKKSSERPFEVYRQIDLGAGGCALSPASGAKEAIRDILRKKVNR